MTEAGLEFARGDVVTGLADVRVIRRVDFQFRGPFHHSRPGPEAIGQRVVDRAGIAERRDELGQAPDRDPHGHAPHTPGMIQPDRPDHRSPSTSGSDSR